MSLSLVKDEAFKPEQHPIEDCLTELEKYGFPIIGKTSRGWYVRINVFVTGKGVEFEVQSDFGVKTPKEALNQCYDRLVKAINQIKETT